MIGQREIIPGFLLTLLSVVALFSLVNAGGHGGGHSHVVIHVPYKIKKIQHTHTITKHIHHGGGGGGDSYEVLGYTYGHPISLGGHDGGGDGHDFGGGGGGHDFGGGGGGGHLELSHDGGFGGGGGGFGGGGLGGGDWGGH
ncbi:hypothetical protein ALC60_05567 [Trachymyrmex zeteki]|uniref:Uncharacterized protein n=1 Tax=Mycetomoellerius zeteki TaxID=64791 RepID=A0A151X503_9HYME|nr:PREDICTED: glycine-rich protein DOT1-like [Trachymyrmex zeteki]KYQ55505.1 hypothetical protein ALC60_05567 [Trachymyrmex zeteki]